MFFYQVEINERALRQLFVINSGKFNFDFTWDLQNKSKLRHKNNKPVVSVGPQKGSVPSNSRKRCMLTFCPPGKCTLQNCTLILEVRKKWHVCRFNGVLKCGWLRMIVMICKGTIFEFPMTIFIVYIPITLGNISPNLPSGEYI